jgi:hypothetical protein
MNVTAAAASPSGSGRSSGTGTLSGHGRRFSTSIRGTAVTGWPFERVGLKKRCPSK